MDRKFRWIEDGVLREASARAIENMTTPQFGEIDGKLVNVNWTQRYDTVVVKADTTVAEGAKQKYFAKGLEEKDTYFGLTGAANEFTKTLVHTNMLKGGEFDEGELTILKNLQIELPMFGGKPTTQAAGIVTNAKATFPATFDPALAAWRWLNQTWIEFIQGNKTIYEGKAIYFMQKAGLYAAFGANAGAYVQNGNGMNIMTRPRVIEGSRDFSVRVTALASWDNTNATGINQELTMGICFETTELREAQP